MTNNQIDAVTNLIMAKFQEANIEYIKLITDHINDIGNLSATDLHRLEQYARMDVNVAKIEEELAKACNMSQKQVSMMINQQASDTYIAQKKWYKAAGVKQVAYAKNGNATQLSRVIYRRTFKTMQNISRTTSIYADYKAIVDEASLLVSQGVENFDKAISKSIRQLQSKGITTQTYPEKLRKNPAYTRWANAINKGEIPITTPPPKMYLEGELNRRLDSALRMNLKEATRSITQGMLRLTGEEFGADGVEIDAHEPCAEDHLEIQGWHGTYDEFETLNNSLERPIGELNCGHEAIPIKLSAYEPTYSKEELDEMREFSKERIELVEGQKQPTRYQCSQKMRNLETKIREQKEKYMGGDAKARAEATMQIKKYKQQYKYIADKSGLPMSTRKMKVSGYTGRY